MAVGSLGFIEDVNTGVEHNFRSHTNRMVSKKCKTKRLRNVTWLDIELNSLVYQKSTQINVLKTLAKCDINRKTFRVKRGAEIFGEIQYANCGQKNPHDGEIFEAQFLKAWSIYCAFSY
jgi:hypothetical protein